MSTVLNAAAIASSTEIAPTTPTGLSSDIPTDASTDEEVLGTSSQAIIACNSISVVACVLVIVIYALLHRKHTRLMQRTSLVLSCAMATSDLLLHATNLVGYFELPPGFACAFIGGWLYAFPSLLSVFYSCCIALNSQLYFVFRRELKDTHGGIGTLLKLYIITPIVVSAIICFSALGAGLYGYDSIFGYCWFASPPEDPDHPHERHMRPLIGMVTTFGGWCLLALLYLLLASSTVAWVVFWKSSDVDFGGHIGLRRNRQTFNSDGSIPSSSASEPRWPGHASTNSADMEMQKKRRLYPVEFEGQDRPSLTLVGDVKNFDKRSLSDLRDDNESVIRAQKEQVGEGDCNIRISPPNPRHSSSAAHSRIDTNPPAFQERPKLSRRTLALRAMTLRLIGYILIPVICILPSVVMDLIVKAYPVGDVEIPDAVTGFFDGINGLVGFFNAMLFLLDPVLLVVWAELRANHHWGLLQRRHIAAQYAEHENHNVNEFDVKEHPLQDMETPRREDADEQVGGVRSTRFGKEDNQPSAKQAFEDSLGSSLPLPGRDDERRFPRFTKAGPKLARIRGMGRRKRHEAHHNGGTGLIIHMQVEVMKYTDLEMVEDFLHGL